MNSLWIVFSNQWKHSQGSHTLLSLGETWGGTSAPTHALLIWTAGHGQRPWCPALSCKPDATVGSSVFLESTSRVSQAPRIHFQSEFLASEMWNVKKKKKTQKNHFPWEHCREMSPLHYSSSICDVYTTFEGACLSCPSTFGPSQQLV